MDLAEFSEGLAEAVAKAASSLVRVDDGSRLTATGVIVSADGYIVTTSHGTESDDEVTVVTHDGTRYDATVIGRDTDTDLALLKVDATNLPALETVPETEVRVGQVALAVARPGEGGLRATLGIVSGRQDTETEGQPEYILATDAIFYPGFSGGALIDIRGRMLGLLNRMFGHGAGVALGTPLVARVVETIKTKGSRKRGYLGIRTQLITLPDTVKAALQTAQERALHVLAVEPNSAAEQAGLLLGDTLLAINEEPVQDVDALRRYLIAGETLRLHIVRAGAVQQVQAVIGE